MSGDLYSTSTWRRVRLVVLDRDGWVCQIRGPGCVRYADCVDHIVPVDAGGEMFNPAGLRAACTPCNSGRANRGRSRAVVRAEVLRELEVSGYPAPWRP